MHLISSAASRQPASEDVVDNKPEVKKVRGGVAGKKVCLSGSTSVFVLQCAHRNRDVLILLLFVLPNKCFNGRLA